MLWITISALFQAHHSLIHLISDFHSHCLSLNRMQLGNTSAAEEQFPPVLKALPDLFPSSLTLKKRTLNHSCNNFPHLHPHLFLANFLPLSWTSGIHPSANPASRVRAMMSPTCKWLGFVQEQHGLSRKEKNWSPLFSFLLLLWYLLLSNSLSNSLNQQTLLSGGKRTLLF